MKLAVRSLILLAVLGSAFAHAQNPAIQHIIIVVQENRTPDDLFQDPNLVAAGADIVPKSTGGKCGSVSVPLIPRPLSDCVNPNHNHNLGWVRSYDSGNMDGACKESYGSFTSGCKPLLACPNGNYPHCPQYAYVDNSIQAGTPIQPYWDIAEKYGFANYMFKRVRGPASRPTSFFCREPPRPTGRKFLFTQLSPPKIWEKITGSIPWKMLDAPLLQVNRCFWSTRTSRSQFPLTHVSSTRR